MADVELGDEETSRLSQPTGSIRVPERRRLGGIVIAAVAGCGLILVAAVIARVSHASGRETAAAAAAVQATAATDVAPAAPVAPAGQTGVAAAQAPSLPASAPGTATGAGPTATAASGAAAIQAEGPITGTLRFDRPALGRVWLDGKRIASKSVLVTCGAHQLKVGSSRGKARSVQVPCGGELVVSK